MVKIDSNSATSTPFWLLASAMTFLLLRFGLSIYENYFPPKPTEVISWRTPPDISDAEKVGQKLFFYDFRAKWSEPGDQMDKTAFVSKDIVRLLDNEFVAIKVTDRKREDGKNSAPVQELEDLYSIEAFPSQVVAMPDGTKISEHLGAETTSGLKKFLQEALILASYFKGKEEYIHGDTRAAASSFDEFLSRTKWQHWRVGYAAIFSSIAHRELGENDKADQLIRDALVKVHEHTFPYPMIEYLGGKRNFDQLLSAASEVKVNRVLAYADAGMDDYARAKVNDAKAKFSWVLENCEDKDSFEYRVSRALLTRINNKEADLSKDKGSVKDSSESAGASSAENKGKNSTEDSAASSALSNGKNSTKDSESGSADGNGANGTKSTKKSSIEGNSIDWNKVKRAKFGHRQ